MPTIDGDPSYPIYSVGLKWVQDIAPGADYSKYPKWLEGLPEGQFWDSAHRYEMRRDDPGRDEIERWAVEEWWPQVRAKYEDRNPADPQVTVKGPRWEIWQLTWFQHKTFDVGQTDEEALASFERYVRRYEHMQGLPTSYQIDRFRDDYICLMGAEDRWRWHGAGESGDRDERSDPPCRCVHCREQGVLRIGH